MPNLLPNLLVFGRLLRALGLEVHMGRMLDVVEALQFVNLGSRGEVYHACRTLLVHRHEDIPTFDRAFDAFWRARATAAPFRDLATALDGEAAREGPSQPAPRGAPRAGDERPPDGVEVETAGALRTWSDAATLAAKDFGEFSEEEIAVAGAALDRLQWTPGERRTRRWIRGSGPRIDLRRALAQSVRTGGDVVRLPRRTRRWRPRPIVLLCDVSGSMERYSRMLLHFAHALQQRHRQGTPLRRSGRQRVEVFVFSTELTRVTTELRRGRLEQAMAHVAGAVPGWSGGTRIGESLRQFHHRWRRRALAGAPVVLIVSDGWDRGDPAMLRDQIARLQRSCHRLIWLNPLIGTLDYAPLTRGLQAALPFVDDFLPARTLTNLADLTVHLNALAGLKPGTTRRPEGRL